MVASAPILARLTQNEEKALQKLIRRLRVLYGDQLEKVILFGSKARGDSTPDSDIDLLVVLEHEDWSIRREIWKLAARIELTYDVLFNIQVISGQRWQRMGEDHFTLHGNISREGISLLEM